MEKSILLEKYDQKECSIEQIICLVGIEQGWDKKEIAKALHISDSSLNQLVASLKEFL